MKMKKKEYMARRESAHALYRWMYHVTKALSDSTIRNKFFHNHMIMVRESFNEFEDGLMGTKNAKKKSKTA